MLTLLLRNRLSDYAHEQQPGADGNSVGRGIAALVEDEGGTAAGALEYRCVNEELALTLVVVPSGRGSPALPDEGGLVVVVIEPAGVSDKGDLLERRRVL